MDDRISVLEEPWALFDFNEDADRTSLADIIRAREIDAVLIGPVTAAGMSAAGTIQEVRAFAALVESVGALSQRRVTFILIHHENKGGQVSGAWEGVGDTLLHVQSAGHRRTRLYVQKARWSSPHHGTTMHLLWADGDSFAVEDRPQLDEAQVAELILAFVAAQPGVGWTHVEEATRGVKADTRRAVRDNLLRKGLLVNLGKDQDGREKLFDYVPERRRARLFLPDDPTIRHLRPDSDADGTQATSAQAAGGNLLCVPASLLYRDAGDVEADQPPPVEEERLRSNPRPRR